MRRFNVVRREESRVKHFLRRIQSTAIIMGEEISPETIEFKGPGN